MRIADMPAFLAAVGAALEGGPVRVDRLALRGGESDVLCVLGGDGTVYWIAYAAERGVVHVRGVRTAGGQLCVFGVAGARRPVRLPGAHAHLVVELALRHQSMTVVRGCAGDFAGIGAL